MALAGVDKITGLPWRSMSHTVSHPLSTGPPDPVPTNSTGGTTTGRDALTREQLQHVIAAAHKALVASDIEIGPSRVARLVHRFKHALRKSRMTFHEFLTDEANRDRIMMKDPELARVLSYADPTGERATNNVMRQQRRKRKTGAAYAARDN